MPKYRRREEIEATRVAGDSTYIQRWLRLHRIDRDANTSDPEDSTVLFEIWTGELWKPVREGDWIVILRRGEAAVYSSEQFWENYTEA